VVPAPAQLSATVKSADERAQAAEARAAAAEGQLGRAQALSTAGAVLGLLGLAAGGWALLSRRRGATGDRQVVEGPAAARP
jgi:hypothetical protein